MGHLPTGREEDGMSHARRTLPEFAATWARSTLTERAAAQQHFLDLCKVWASPSRPRQT
uniref:Uncharacterized protein n=1 Tax=uncultured Armatimonadetes bacterium TaxID=157466 RepID=A0A6J4J643_9BACT|nr:hypothetical protein AVDCRST_MAG63-2838 [uncultured Armatimonadetes bacterium]